MDAPIGVIWRHGEAGRCARTSGGDRELLVGVVAVENAAVDGLADAHVGAIGAVGKLSARGLPRGCARLHLTAVFGRGRTCGSETASAVLRRAEDLDLV
ncbi:MAG: hypothetical protein ACK55I_18665, partial [bacterium]